MVSARDIVSWWAGGWTCAGFPALAPTVVREILALSEQMHPLAHRVARRLVGRGLLCEQLAGPWPFELPVEARRTHSAARADGASRGVGWVLAALATEGWRRHPPPEEVPDHADEVTAALELIVRKHDEATIAP